MKNLSEYCIEVGHELVVIFDHRPLYNRGLIADIGVVTKVTEKRISIKVPSITKPVIFNKSDGFEIGEGALNLELVTEEWREKINLNKMQLKTMWIASNIRQMNHLQFSKEFCEKMIELYNTTKLTID